jgi:hypothetical protein
MNESDEYMNWRWVPSPQSKRITSLSRLMAIEGTLRILDGQLPPVPRNINFMIATFSHLPNINPFENPLGSIKILAIGVLIITKTNF